MMPAFGRARRSAPRRFLASVVFLLLLLSRSGGAEDRPLTIEAFYEPGQATRVIAHRGFSGRAPENTLASIREAISVGAHMAEIDITLTGDGEMVCLHDETLERTTNGRGVVASFTLAELKTLDAGSWFAPQFKGERIPTLEEVLDTARDRILLNVEIKSEAVAGGITTKLAEMLQEMAVASQVVVSSFSPLALEEMHDLAPKIRTTAIFNRKLHRGVDPLEIVLSVGAESFAINRRFKTAWMEERCREHDIPIAVYTVNSKRQMKRLVKQRIHAIFTDHPDRLLEVLSETEAAALLGR